MTAETRWGRKRLDLVVTRPRELIAMISEIKNSALDELASKDKPSVWRNVRGHLNQIDGQAAEGAQQGLKVTKRLIYSIVPRLEGLREWVEIMAAGRATQVIFWAGGSREDSWLNRLPGNEGTWDAIIRLDEARAKSPLTAEAIDVRARLAKLRNEDETE